MCVRARVCCSIAVLEVPLVLGWSAEKEAVLNPLQPCGACSEWLQKLQEANPEFRCDAGSVLAGKACILVHSWYNNMVA